MNRAASACTLLVLLGMAACDSPSASEQRTPANVVAIGTVPSSAAVRSEITVTVRVTDARSQPVAGATVEWVANGGTVSPASIQTDAAGLASATWTLGTTPGSQSLAARVGALEQVLSVEATPRPAAQVAMMGTVPSSAVVRSAITVTVRVTDAESQPVPGATVEWIANGGTASPATIQTDAAGLASTIWTLATTPGSQSLAARVGALEQIHTVQATPGAAAQVRAQPDSERLGALGQTTQLSASAFDSFGNPLSGGIAWNSLDPGVATVSTTGLVTAVVNGTARVVASQGTAADTVPVTVAQVATTVTVTPDSSVLLPGSTRQLSAAALDARGNLVAGTQFDWSSSNPAVATVSTSGLVTVHKEGRATISATPRGAAAQGSSTVLASGWASLDTDWYRTCAALKIGGAICQSNERDAASPGSLPYTRAYTGYKHSCGLTADGTAYCWGDNQHGQLGSDIATPSATLRRVDTTLRFASLTLGHEHTCGLTADGTAYCWGRNAYGELGIGAGTQRRPDQPVSGGIRWRQLAGGIYDTCGVAEDGRGYCWGGAIAGQTGHVAHTRVPTEVVAGMTWREIRSNHYFTCGLSSSGAPYCWGGQVPSRPRPIPGGSGFVTLDLAAVSGNARACALNAAGETYCWTFTPSTQTAPVRRSDAPTFSMIRVETDRICGLTPGGEIYCSTTGGFSRITLE